MIHTVREILNLLQAMSPSVPIHNYHRLCDLCYRLKSTKHNDKITIVMYYSELLPHVIANTRSLKFA